MVNQFCFSNFYSALPSELLTSDDLIILTSLYISMFIDTLSCEYLREF